MKKLLSLSVFVLSLAFAGRSLTYYTINNGDWNNTTNVWSTNGTTASFCAPGFNWDTDTVVIRNDINFNTHLVIQGGAVLKVLSGAKLYNSSMKITVRDGVLFSNGTIFTRELNVLSQGVAQLFSSTLYNDGQMNIQGSFSANFSNIYVNSGNIEVFPGGSFTIENNCKVFFTVGNFNNSGNTTVSDNSCIQLTAGNIKNFASGTMSGNGSMISDAGNIINDGTWANSLNWCVQGTASGLTSPENCPDSYANCSFAPLSAELLSYSVVPQKNSNLINWYTQSENSGEYYTVERSNDMENWELIGKIAARNEGSQVTHYVLIDEQPIKGLSYYRLTFYTKDERIGFTAIRGVNSLNTDDVTVFPNPTTDHITVRFSRPLENVTITIKDGAGQTVETYTSDSMLEETFHLPYSCGMYYVNIDSETFKDVIKVIKR